MSSLNLPGFSISLVLLPREPVETGTSFSSRITFDQELVIEMLDAPASAPGWRYHYKGKPEARIQVENKKHKVVKKAESELKGPKREFSLSGVCLPVVTISQIFSVFSCSYG